MSGVCRTLPKVSVVGGTIKTPRQVRQHRPGLTTYLIDLTERRG